MKSRILPLDGLRTIAALGVVWIHTWTFFGAPSLKLFSVDLYKAIAILGNGVDFFFVISGFCMYLMIDKKDYSVQKYLLFIKKRFIRIAPAFYASTLLYAGFHKFIDPSFSFFYNVFFHFLFFNNVVTGNTIAGTFWSIGTEWHFYMLLPLIILLIKRLSLVKTIVFVSTGCFILFCIVNLGFLNYNWWESQIFIRFPEFGVGIIAAYFFIEKRKLSGLFSGTSGLMIAFAVTYLGRLLEATEIIKLAGDLGWLLKSSALFIMTSGFAYLLYLVITERSLLSRFLSLPFMSFLGKISYSIYLWQTLGFMILGGILSKLPFKNINPIIGFVILSSLTVVIARISYSVFESFYFSPKKNETTSAHNFSSGPVLRPVVQNVSPEGKSTD